MMSCLLILTGKLYIIALPSYIYVIYAKCFFKGSVVKITPGTPGTSSSLSHCYLWKGLNGMVADKSWTQTINVIKYRFVVLLK